MNKERVKPVNLVNKINDEKWLEKQHVLSETENTLDLKTKVRNSYNEVFLNRLSLLTILPENKHFAAMKNVLLSIFAVLLLQCIIADYFEGLMFNTGFRLVAMAFRKFDILLVSWTLLFISTIAVYICFHIWCQIRTIISKETRRMLDIIFISFYMSYLIFPFYYACKVCFNSNLPFATAGILMIEQCRLSMKVHAFIRTNVSLWLKKNYHEEVANTSITKFVYFLFAPTLIYNNDYPRTKIIRWRHVFTHILELIIAVILIGIIYDKTFVPFSNRAGFTSPTWKEFVLFILTNIVNGMVLKLLIFWIVLHIIQNFFAELLRFADREFYSDWWTSFSLQTHLRKWNILVHNWLFTFVYKDMYQLTNHKLVSRLTVIFISALCHEIIISAVLRIFMPVLFVQFFILGSIVCAIKEIKHPLMNSLHWLNLAFGITVQLTLCSLEYYARVNCHVEYNNFSDFFKVRFLDENCNS